MSSPVDNSSDPDIFEGDAGQADDGKNFDHPELPPGVTLNQGIPGATVRPAEEEFAGTQLNADVFHTEFDPVESASLNSDLEALPAKIQSSVDSAPPIAVPSVALDDQGDVARSTAQSSVPFNNDSSGAQVSTEPLAVNASSMGSSSPLDTSASDSLSAPPAKSTQPLAVPSGPEPNVVLDPEVNTSGQDPNAWQLSGSNASVTPFSSAAGTQQQIASPMSASPDVVATPAAAMMSSAPGMTQPTSMDPSVGAQAPLLPAAPIIGGSGGLITAQMSNADSSLIDAVTSALQGAGRQAALMASTVSLSGQTLSIGGSSRVGQKNVPASALVYGANYGGAPQFGSPGDPFGSAVNAWYQEQVQNMMPVSTTQVPNASTGTSSAGSTGSSSMDQGIDQAVSSMGDASSGGG